MADAKALLRARRGAAASSLAGYAFEGGRKSCLLARWSGEAEWIFEEKRFSEKGGTPLLPQRLERAGWQAALAVDTAVDQDLSRSWDTAKAWRESSR